MSDVHMILIVKPNPFTDPAAIADVELPRKLNSRTWSENYSRTDLSTEKTENPDAKA